MAKSLRSGWRSFIGLIAFIAICSAIPIVDRILNSARGEEFHQQLVGAFRSTVPFPESVVVKTTDSFSSWRPRQALVEEKYATNATYAMVRKHYDDELIPRGWRLLDDRSVTGWGKDLGGRVTEYCRGPLKASLQYAGSEADYGWSFAFSMSWGVGSRKCK